PVVLHSHVLAFEITRFFTEPFKKRCGLALGRTGRHPLTKPTTGIVGCCARAASGHAATAPPSRVRELAPLHHSITQSARASSIGGRSRPTILAVWALMTSSNLLDRTPGRSAGLAPLRTRPAYTPA